MIPHGADEAWMRVNASSPSQLEAVVQAYEPCHMFTVEMEVWSGAYVPSWLYVIPYGSPLAASQPPFERIWSSTP